MYQLQANMPIPSSEGRGGGGGEKCEYPGMSANPSESQLSLQMNLVQTESLSLGLDTHG